VKVTTKRQDVMLLLGAGAAVPVGIPAMGGFYRAFLRPSESGIGAAEKRICTLLTGKLGVPSDLESFLLACDAVLGLEDQPLHGLLRRVVAPKHGERALAKFSRTLNKHLSDVQRTREHILQFMSRTCFRFDRTEAIEVFSDLVRVTAEQRVPVFTTNYDPVIETVARRNEIALCDNFARSGDRFVWDPNVRYSGEEGLHLVKLQGSVTWYSSEDGTIEKIDHYTDLDTEGKDATRLVIFPTRFKDIYDRHFFALYQRFLGSLANARCLLIIGHSLRDEYIRAAILERLRLGHMDVVALDPSLPSCLTVRVGRTKRLVEGVHHIPRQIEHFARDLAHILDHEDASRIAAACVKLDARIEKPRNRLSIKGSIGQLRPGEKKLFEAIVDAYVPLGSRPAMVRIWLTATLRTEEGPVTQVLSSFVEDKPVVVADGANGVVTGRKPLSMTVPHVRSWLDGSAKVQVHTGLLPAEVQTPRAAARRALAIDTRELTYRRV